MHSSSSEGVIWSNQHTVVGITRGRSCREQSTRLYVADICLHSVYLTVRGTFVFGRRKGRVGDRETSCTNLASDLCEEYPTVRGTIDLREERGEFEVDFDRDSSTTVSVHLRNC